MYKSTKDVFIFNILPLFSSSEFVAEYSMIGDLKNMC